MILIWLVGLSLSAVGYFWTLQNNSQAVEQRTETLIDDAVKLIQDRFNLYQYGLRGARGAAVVAGPKTHFRPSFENYINSRDFNLEFPGALGFGYIRRVALDQELDFIQQARADGAPNFNIRYLNPHQKDRFVIQYVYPEAPNRGAIGLDVASESSRRKAAIDAALSNETQLSAPITLVQAEGAKRGGFLILMPVYDQDAILDTADEKLAATVGWSYAPLIVDDVLFELGRILDEVSLSILDNAESEPFFNTAPELNPTSVYSSIASRKISFMGRQWIVTAESLPQTNEINHLTPPSRIASIGVFLTLLASISWFIWRLKVKSIDSQKINLENVNFANFLSSHLSTKLLLGYFVAIIFMLFSVSFYLLKYETSLITSQLAIDAKTTEARLQERQNDYYRDLTFLKSSPAVKNLLRAFDAGMDPLMLDLATNWASV